MFTELIKVRDEHIKNIEKQYELLDAIANFTNTHFGDYIEFSSIGHFIWKTDRYTINISCKSVVDTAILLERWCRFPIHIYYNDKPEYIYYGEMHLSRLKNITNEEIMVDIESMFPEISCYIKDLKKFLTTLK